MSIMRSRTMVMLAAVGFVFAGALAIWSFSDGTHAPAQESPMTDDELAVRLAQNPTMLLQPDEEWRALPAPARTIWTTWRFGLMASGLLPWAVGDGMPTVAEMGAGFTALGLPQAAELVNAYAASDATPERRSACQARFQRMRAEITGAQIGYLRAHLAEATRRAD